MVEILEEQVDDYIQRKKASASQTAEQFHARGRENGSCSNRCMHVYEVRPRRDQCGFDLISDCLPFGSVAYGMPRVRTLSEEVYMPTGRAPAHIDYRMHTARLRQSTRFQ
jgi:hypothetical protein